ncbi:hypothetical protein Vadar_010318 [Vaccinium darrowii]|uniref:Uncharacterized protein n=1 Tax=Vaccinium darrowii TaxID=229202 RepID=A0ACB7XGL4_9ERIC|nr:hypothetical protein Vadar_010318 [Vaccinium darrowii]
MHEIRDSNVQLSASIGRLTNNVNNMSKTISNSLNHLLAIVAKESRGKDKEQLSLEFRPMGRPIYTRPYLDEVENESFPMGYRVREFYWFSGEDTLKAARYEKILKEEADSRSASKGTYYRDPNYEVATAEMDCNPKCAVAEMVNKKPHVLRTGNIELKADVQVSSSNKSPRAYSFDITKAETIFDQLVVDKMIKFPPGRKLPSPEELKGKEHCKYHNSWSHSTNNCMVLRNDIQDKIERVEFKFKAKEGKKVLGVDKNPFSGGLNTNMVFVNMRGFPRTTPRTKISLGAPSREAKRSGYEDYESEDKYSPLNRPLFQQQWPRQQQQWSRWNRPALEIRNSPRPRCSLTCNECGQRIDSQRSQAKDKAVNYYPSRPQGLSQERKIGPPEKHFSVFSRLTTSLENVQEDLCKLSITTPNQGRRRTMKPHSTPLDEWYRAKHPKFPARPPPLSRSQKRRYQRFTQAARRAREESGVLEDMEEDTWEDTEMLEALEQDSMDMDHFDEAVEFMTKGAKKSPSASTSTTLPTLKEVTNSCEESPEGRRERKPKERVIEEDAPKSPRQVRMLKRTQPTLGKREFVKKAQPAPTKTRLRGHGRS